MATCSYQALTGTRLCRPLTDIQAWWPKAAARRPALDAQEEAGLERLSAEATLLAADDAASHGACCLSADIRDALMLCWSALIGRCRCKAAASHGVLQRRHGSTAPRAHTVRVA